MLCNHAKSRQSLLLLTALLAGLLAACGGDEPAPAPPPPAPPPRPAFVPKDVPIDLGTSGEQVTLQTTEAGGYTLKGEAFASGTTVEAGGNTYRLTLADDEWTAEYVPPRPWATALGTSGDALLITRREDGLYEADEDVFSSGGTVTATNGNQYRLTLNEETNSWQVEFVPPEPIAVLLGLSGVTVLVERLEGGGYSVGGQRIVDGSTVSSASGATYRLTMQDGVWTASFIPGPPVMVALGSSGQTVTLQLGEDGNYQRNGQPIASGTEILADGNLYRLILADGQWTADFVAPPPVRVQLGTSGQAVTLQRREDGQYYRNGQLFASGATVEAGGETYQLTLQAGQWTANPLAPILQMVRLGTSDVTLTLRLHPNGDWTEDGDPVQNGDVRRVGDRRYRLLLDDGEWSAEYLRDTIPVEGAGGLIILFREEDGTLSHNGRTVDDGSTITQDGRTYELLRLSDGSWLATPGEPPVTEGDQNVSLPNGQTITLRRTSRGTYTYNGNPVSSGSQITVGENRYVLTQGTDDTWSAAVVQTRTPGNEGGIGGPTLKDKVNRFTSVGTGDPSSNLFNAFGTDRSDNVGVTFRDRGKEEAVSTGISLVPNALPENDEHKFSVYDLLGRGVVSYTRTYVEVAKAELQEIIAVIQETRYAEDDVRGTLDPDDHIRVGLGANAGLWQQAANALARIFGTVDDASTTATDEVLDLLGREPWDGRRVEVDEVDDVVEALQDMVAVLSDVDRFGREFEDQIGTSDPADFFNGIASRIRFGSTSGTRFGAFAVKKSEHADGNRINAASPDDVDYWNGGVFAYTPLDQPTSDAVRALRGRAVYSGDTVAWELTNGDLYAGKIELEAKFSQGDIDGTITDLRDEDDRVFRHYSADLLRSDDVKSITLPTAASRYGNTQGFYSTNQTTAGDFAEVTFESTRRKDLDDDESAFQVQLVNNGTEALGIWKAFNLEGSFGATRSGDARTPTLPRSTDRGVHVHTASAQRSGSGTSTFALKPGDDEQYVIRIPIAALGLSTISEFRTLVTEAYNEFVKDDSNADFLQFELDDLFRLERDTILGSGIARRVSNALNASRTEDPSVRLSSLNVLRPVLDLTTSFVLPASTLTQGEDETADAFAARQRTEQQTALNTAVTDLRSTTRFENAQKNERSVLYVATEADRLDRENIGKLLAAKEIDFEIRFESTQYTRFGAWAQRALPSALSTDTTIEHEVFAYSQAAPAENIDLNFTATYEGHVRAVNETTGELYDGAFLLRVDWTKASSSDNSITSTITDLKTIAGNKSFRHVRQDVKSIYLSAIDTASSPGTFTDSLIEVDLEYTNGTLRRNVTATGSNISGQFVDLPEAFSEGPVGVFGIWRLVFPAGDADSMRGSFGADLKP